MAAGSAAGGPAFCVEKLPPGTSLRYSSDAALLVVSGVVRVEGSHGEPLDAGPGNIIPLEAGSSRIKPLYGPAVVVILRGCRPGRPLTRGFGIKCSEAKLYDLVEDAEAEIPSKALIVALRRTIIKTNGSEQILEPGEMYECRDGCMAAAERRLHIVVIEPP